MAWKSFPQGEREQYEHRIVPVSPLVCLTPVQVSGRALSACIKVFALLIGCKQAKSSLGEKKSPSVAGKERLLNHFCLLIITAIRPPVENLYLIKSLTSPRRYSRLLRPVGESLRLTSPQYVNSQCAREKNMTQSSTELQKHCCWQKSGENVLIWWW